MSDVPIEALPVVDPRETITTMTNRVSVVPFRGDWAWWWWAFVPSALLLGLGILGVGWAFLRGIRVWGNDWPVMWGFPILAYVWWIAIASGGTFVSAFFFLVRVQWRTSINRMAETMTLCAAACAGVYPILHLGRPYFAYWLFPYPNTMTLWPQWKSPLLWDFMALLTYVIASVLFWYLGAMPDLATMRDRARSKPAQMAYGFFAMGFRGTGAQWRHLKATYGTLAAIMAPLVVSVHSIVGLDFAGGATPGWHSTEYPPFFVFGALWSGLSTVMLLLLAFRRPLRLTTVITERHIQVLAKLMLTSSLCMSYAYVLDAFEPFYSGDATDRIQFLNRLLGGYAPIYWGMIFCNCLFPLVLCVRRVRASHAMLALVAVSSIIGMWLERFNIVELSLTRTHLPSAWGSYVPTFWDWAVFGGTIGLFMSGFLLAVRLIPMVSMFEMRELLTEQGQGT
ncbi:NrfD/PsrC family molybdoenzyme membrane anchor subunit [Rhodopila sp.]|uniref:NrfD/PsrC family molybdoenzyme membrane anchor subunit n=1 Tax=Rhodopila sp. TaxID=2480087 RepID=UPI003D0DDE96